MFKKKLFVFLAGCVALALVIGVVLAQDEKTAPAKPPLPQIPGITAKDDHPNGCADCHKVIPEYKMDVRLSTLTKAWNEKGAEPEIVNVAKASAADPNKITGKHPDISSLLKDNAEIPTVCLQCHSAKSELSPPFAKMLHLIHLSTKKENHFLLHYGGFCTNCHKVDGETGKVTVKVGTEQK